MKIGDRVTTNGQDSYVIVSIAEGGLTSRLSTPSHPGFLVQDDEGNRYWHYESDLTVVEP